MKTIVIYDSFFGNTEKIARIIGNSLGSEEDVRIVKVDSISAAELEGASLIVVGSPTRAFSASPNITAFLKSLPDKSLTGMHAAAFDTRASVQDVNNKLLTFMVKIFGYAAEPIAKILIKKGAELALPAEGFFVGGNEGPLKDGEEQRAAEWAAGLRTRG